MTCRFMNRDCTCQDAKNDSCATDLYSVLCRGRLDCKCFETEDDFQDYLRADEALEYEV